MDNAKSGKENIVIMLIIVIVLLILSLVIVTIKFMPPNDIVKSYEIGKATDSSLSPGQVYVKIGNTQSMEPTLSSNNKVICSLAPSKIDVGDIIVFKNDLGEYIIHRVINKFSDGFQTKGDNNLFVDKKISKDQVYCKVETILF